MISIKKQAHIDFSMWVQIYENKNSLSTQKVYRERIGESGKELGNNNGKTCYFPFLQMLKNRLPTAIRRFTSFMSFPLSSVNVHDG